MSAITIIRFIFLTAAEEPVTIDLRHPTSSITEAELATIAAAILAAGVFVSPSGDPLATLQSADYLTTTTEELFE